MGVWWVLAGLEFDASGKFAVYEGLVSILQRGGEAKLELKHEHTVKLASQCASKPFKEVHLSVYLTVLIKPLLRKPIYH